MKGFQETISSLQHNHTAISVEIRGRPATEKGKLNFKVLPGCSKTKQIVREENL
jgi:hypothetical protein